MKLVTCQFKRHADAILAMFNEEILNSTALYEYKPRTMGIMREWFAVKKTKNYPVIGLENELGELLGFATYGSFRNIQGCKYTVELSVYVEKAQRGKGIARKLMTALIQKAQQQNYHVLMGAIDGKNAASISLHQSLGFTHCASIKQAGFKFGEWLDIELYQLIFETPQNPTEK